MRTLFSRINALLPGVTVVRNWKLAEMREKLAGKDESLRRLVNRVKNQDRELEGLRAALRSAKEDGVGVDPANIVWIFGTARTGSTWLGSIMGELSNNAVWSEPYAGTLFAPTFSKLDWHYTISGRRDSILSPLYKGVWQKSLRSLILDGASARFPDLAGDGCLIVKDPHGSVGAVPVMEAIPESRMVLLIRDPRDVAASILDSSRGWRKKTWEQTEDPDEIVRIRAELYMESVGNARQAYEAHEGLKTLVRYEDLRADPTTAMRRVCDAVGIMVGEDALASAIEKHSWERIPEERKGAGKFYRKASPGGWREDLSGDQIEAVERITAPVLDEFYSGR